MSRQEYLNRYVNTDNLNYTISQSKWDNGDFCERFDLTRTKITKTKQSEPEQPRMGLYADMFTK